LNRLPATKGIFLEVLSDFIRFYALAAQSEAKGTGFFDGRHLCCVGDGDMGGFGGYALRLGKDIREWSEKLLRGGRLDTFLFYCNGKFVAHNLKLDWSKGGYFWVFSHGFIIFGLFGCARGWGKMMRRLPRPNRAGTSPGGKENRNWRAAKKRRFPRRLSLCAFRQCLGLFVISGLVAVAFAFSFSHFIICWVSVLLIGVLFSRKIQVSSSRCLRRVARASMTGSDRRRLGVFGAACQRARSAGFQRNALLLPVGDTRAERAALMNELQSLNPISVAAARVLSIRDAGTGASGPGSRSMTASNIDLSSASSAASVSGAGADGFG
jgi:hypothetical protein